MTAMNDLTGQYLTFVVGGETYGVNIHQVREVLEYREPVKTPRSAPHVSGVINLRGRAVTVMDLRRRFGLEPARPTVDTCIIIFETKGADGKEVVSGALADSVKEVTGVDGDQLEPVPESSAAGGLVLGLARREDGFVMLLDAARLFGGEPPEVAAPA